jgi:hypothetical protein
VRINSITDMPEYESERRAFAQDLIEADKIVMTLSSRGYQTNEERLYLLE